MSHPISSKGLASLPRSQGGHLFPLDQVSLLFYPEMHPRLEKIPRKPPGRLALHCVCSPLCEHVGKFLRVLRPRSNPPFHHCVWGKGLAYIFSAQKSFVGDWGLSLLLTSSPSMAALSQWVWWAGSGVWLKRQLPGLEIQYKGGQK